MELWSLSLCFFPEDQALSCQDLSPLKPFVLHSYCPLEITAFPFEVLSSPSWTPCRGVPSDKQLPAGLQQVNTPHAISESSCVVRVPTCQASHPLLRLGLCSISEPPHQLLLRTAHYGHGSICGFKFKGTHRLIGRVYYRFMLVFPHRTTAVHYLAIAIST
jgi:hypothetical protein